VSSDIDAIVSELTQVVAAISRAQEEALGAAEQAMQITMRAAGMGYAAIASQLNAIRQQIQVIHATLGTAATRVGDAGDSVREVNDRMNPTEVTARMTAAVGQLDGMRATLYAAVQQIATTSGNVSQSLHGGQPGPLLQRLDLVRQLAAIAAQRGDGAKASINATISTAGGLGKGVTGGEPSPPAATTPPPASASGTGFDPQPHLDQMPAFVNDRRRRPKTQGRWVDADGEVHPLLSGEHDGTYRKVNDRAVELASSRPGRRCSPAATSS
jgi:uncharacterized protein YoxC